MQYKSPSKSNFKEIQIEQRDFLIEQLKDENFSLKQRERDFAKLSETFLGLQKRLGELQVNEEGLLNNKSLKESVQIKNMYNLKEETMKLKKELEPKIALNKKLSYELEELKAININAQRDLKAKYEYNDMQEKITADLSNQLKHEDAKLNLLSSDWKYISAELVKTKLLKDKVLTSTVKNEEKIKNNQMTSEFLEKEYYEQSRAVVFLKNEKSKMQSELVKKLDEKQTNENEKDIFQKLNLDLVREGEILEQKNILISSQINGHETKLKEIDSLIKEKESDIYKTNLGLNYNESKQKDAIKVLKDLKEERENLFLLIDHYKQEGETNKILKEDHLRKLTLIDYQKKLVEKDLIEKDKLASTAKMSFKLKEEEKRKLEADHYYLDKELDSLKGHTFLLENQNLNLHTEIDKISYQDEKLRAELDRKFRLELLKKENINELQKSAEKVRLSQSPKKFSPYKN